jgi:penicillin-insensitive murein endopeptidase
MTTTPKGPLRAAAAILALLVAGQASAEPAARDLFGAVSAPAAMPAAAIGTYAKGCLAGGEMLPTEGPAWQAMRLSRNRNWGHPALIRFLTAFASRASAATGWPGILVGDIAQPRGGPMKTGHASHQIGLDADVWLTPMPNRLLSRQEREDIKATEMVAPGGLTVTSDWTDRHRAFVRAAALEPKVERIFVNAAIKKDLCRTVGGDRSWLNKVRPMYGHTFHMHLRLSCASGGGSCEPQAPTPPGDGCGPELDWWFRPEVLHPKPVKPAKPMTLDALPAACRAVLAAPAP